MTNNSSLSQSKPLLTIGLPVFNGEKFLEQRIKSILSQTFENFQLIISDNASTDSTSEICLKYSKSDNRIRYTRQKENIGLWSNFYFLLEQANTKYFVWAAVDDIWEKKFLQKNISILESNKNVICCISKFKSYKVENDLKSNSIDLKFRNLQKKILYSVRSYNTYEFSGSYEKKVKKMLKKSGYLIFYSVFRTDILKKSCVHESFVGLDAAFALNVLKYGDASVIDEPLVQRFTEGISTKGSISLAKQFNKSFLGLIFPHYPLTLWASKNLGSKIYFQNLDHFILLNLGSEFFMLVDLVRLFIHKLQGK